MTISLARIQCHMCFPPPAPGLSGNPWPVKERKRKHICVEQRSREMRRLQRRALVMAVWQVVETHPSSLVWQKNKHRATKLSLSPALMDKRWFFPNETCWPSGNGRRGLTNGSAPPEPDTVVLRVSGPLGRVSHSSALLSAEPLNSSCLMTTATWPDGRKEAFITTPALHFHLFLH